MNQNYALIIGVHDYRTFDPSGQSNVPGAQRDAQTWYRACLAMGFSPQNIRVLTSPPLDPRELGPDAAHVKLGPATRSAMVEGLQWLSEKLGEDAPRTGLVTFTGHGEEGDDGFPLLCPSDTTSSLEEVINVGALREQTSANVKDNLTMMLDCCHAQAGVDVEQSIRIRLRAKRAGEKLPERARARVVAACRRDQESVSARFLGEEMGTFTWAATSALGQWQTIVEQGVATVDISYGNLVERMRALSSALSFVQEPVLSGPRGMVQLAFLHPAAVLGSGETQNAPTAERKGHQLDGGQINANQYQQYTWYYSTGTESKVKLVDIYVTSTSGTDFPEIGGIKMVIDEEYWVFRTSMATFSRDYNSITRLWIECAPSSSGANIDLASGMKFYKAAEGQNSGWSESSGRTIMPGAMWFASNSSTSVVQMISLDQNSNTPIEWFWVQTGQRNLIWENLNGLSMVPTDSNVIPSGYYYDPSVFSGLTAR